MAVYDQRPPRLALGMYKRFVLGVLVIFLATSGAVATAALLEVKDDANIFNGGQIVIPGINDGKSASPLDGVDGGGPQTLLLLGSDKRYTDGKGEPSRSDTIILVRLNPDKGVTTVLSLPRDLRVSIPGHGMDKINAAYADGGPALTVRTVKALLGVPINHVVNVNFNGFQRAVNKLGCIYADVDRHYFNDNMPPNGGGPPYAVIDIPAGYQKLCGSQALSYVRFRHLDSDVVRGARQQDFLRQAKDQVGLAKIFDNRKDLLRIFGHYTQTDIRGTTAILRLLKLTALSASKPVQEVHIADLQDSGNDLAASPAALQRAANQFLNAQASSGPRAQVKVSATDKRKVAAQKAKAKRQKDTAIPAGLISTGASVQNEVALLGAKLAFPAYYPKLQTLGAVPQTSTDRNYEIEDRSNHHYEAYRLVVSVPGPGQYYGIQGTTWMSPPLLDNPSETRTVNGRKLMLFFDGDRLRLVSWRTPRAVYWVSNTLLETLTNKQMLGIASSLTRLGA